METIVQEDRPASGRPHLDGSGPPVESLELAKSLLSAHHAAQVAKRTRQRLEMARIQETSRRLALAHTHAQADELRQLEQERRRVIEQRLKAGGRGNGHANGQGNGHGNGRSRPNRHTTAQDVHMNARAGVTLAVPPYDFEWVSDSGQGIEHADHTTGNYDLRVQSIGDGENDVAAGVGFWFFSGDGNPMQRFSAVIDYFDDWWNSAEFYVGHNNGRTRLWVFGASENAWVAQSDQTPSWSDGVGWLEEHGNDPDGEDGTVANETFFNAAPNSFYQCWIWSSADVYADSGFWGFAASSINMSVGVRLGVLGGL